MKKIYYSYLECIEDCKKLLPQIKKFNPEVILPIARGGLTIGHMISCNLDIRKVYSLNSIHYDGDKKLNTIDIYNIPNLDNYTKVLIVDDIVDSGDTMVEVKRILTEKFPNCEFKIATIFYKKDAHIEPDFMVREAKAWIEFFWEIDLNKEI